MNKRIKDIANTLRKVAELYYDGKIPEPRLWHGICAVVWDINPKHYSLLSTLILLHTKGKVYLCKPGTKWDQRALFALLLAESLNK